MKVWINETDYVRSLRVGQRRVFLVQFGKGDLLVCESGGRSFLVPHSSLNSLGSIQRRAELNQLKLINFVQFVRSTVDSLSAEESKTVKKKVSKKETERLLAAKEELLQTAIEKVKEANKKAEEEFKETPKDIKLEELLKVSFDDSTVPGIHYFDTVCQTYQSIDTFGRTIATAVTDCLPMTKRVSYGSLTNESKPEYEEFFFKHSSIIGNKKLSTSFLRTNNKIHSKLLNKEKICENWPFSKEEKPTGLYKRLTAVEELESFERSQNKLKRRIDPSLTIDVCRLHEKETELPPNSRLLKSFLSPICQIDNLESFKAKLSEHKNWTIAQQTTSKFFGLKSIANQSSEEFALSLSRKISCLEAIFDNKPTDYYLSNEEQTSETEAVVSVASHPTYDTKLLAQRISKRQSVKENTGEGKSLIGNCKRPPKQNSLTKSSSLLQELSPRYVTNYFETLEGKQYSINNPPPKSPVALSPSEQVLIEQLKQSAIADQNTGLIAPNTIKTVQEAKVCKIETCQKVAKKTQKPIELMSLNERKQLLKETLKAEDEANKRYHEAKSPKFDVYGDARARLPHVPSLYKQTSEHEDSLIDKDDSGKAECFVGPSTLHRFRNYAPHHLLFQSMDKGWKNEGKLRFDGPETGFVCEATKPESGDIIIYPSQVDFGRLADSGCYELKFTLVNVDWVVQKVIVRPPIETPAISVICSQESFAPGLKKTVFVQVDARKMSRGLFVHNVLVETRYKSYRVRVSGIVVDKNDKSAINEKTEEVPVLTTFSAQQSVKPVQFKVRNVLGEQQNKSKATQSIGMTSDHLPRLFYDKNFTVRSSVISDKSGELITGTFSNSNANGKTSVSQRETKRTQSGNRSSRTTNSNMSTIHRLL